jgi:hemin uptake protein HemP
MTSRIPPSNSLSDPSSASTDDASAGNAAPHAGRQMGVKRIASHVLFSGSNEVEIDHKGLIYRLRQTSLGKLILTK